MPRNFWLQGYWLKCAFSIFCSLKINSGDQYSYPVCSYLPCPFGFGFRVAKYPLYLLWYFEGCCLWPAYWLNKIASWLSDSRIVSNCDFWAAAKNRGAAGPVAFAFTVSINSPFVCGLTVSKCAKRGNWSANRKFKLVGFIL